MEAGERPQSARCGRRTDILLSNPRPKVVALGYNQYDDATFEKPLAS
jgi:hypothetical protein